MPHFARAPSLQSNRCSTRVESTGKGSGMLRLATILGSVLLLATAPAQALTTTYNLVMNGLQEVGVGDLDGLATGTITFDDSALTVSWNLSYLNLDPLTGFHIHGPGGPVGVNAGIFISLGTATTGGAGTLINSTAATLAQINAIVGNPTDFYVNIHTT